MAKAHSVAAAETPKDFIKCVGYFLTVKNGLTGVNFDIRVNGVVHVDGDVDKIDEYNLQSNSTVDLNAELVATLIKRIGEKWPKKDFEFRANNANIIIEVK